MSFLDRKISLVFEGLLLLALLSGASLPVNFQAKQSNPLRTPVRWDNTGDPIPSAFLHTERDSSSTDLPHLMPPHPDLLESVLQGKSNLSESLADADLNTQIGIDQPQLATSPTGIFRTLAILVNFTDHPSQVGAVSFDSLLFGSGQGTLPDYYHKVSYGILDIVTVNFPGTLGWMTMPQTYQYYVYQNYQDPDRGINGGYGIYGPFPRNSQKLAADAARAADPLVNYANYDNNNDGKVDSIFIIHAGPGAEKTGSKSDIWSHTWNTNFHDRPILDGKTIYSYTTEPEYWITPGDMTIGVFAHEFGHILGLPDLYDTDGTSRGLGFWSLMASGGWNGPGYLGESPSYPDPWSRIKLGWASPTLLTTHSFAVSFPNAENFPVIYKLIPAHGGPGEYYLVENRQKYSYDAFLPGDGLLIWHIDNSRVNNSLECKYQDNSVCKGYNYLVALEQADGLMELENNIGYGNPGDPFPGTMDNRLFNDTTIPNTSSYYYPYNNYLEVGNISDSSMIMSADFYIGAIDHSFAKTTPGNLLQNLPANLTLAWGSSLGATSYEYCLDTSFDNSCSTAWINVGPNQTIALNNLAGGVRYYWQVRSNHIHGVSVADSGTWWSFTTQDIPTLYTIFLPLLIQ